MADLSIPRDEDFKKAKEELMQQVLVDTLSVQKSGEPIIMNAIRDEESGEMVATDVISASTVVARFRNVAERFGKVGIEFDITVPAEMIESSWKLRFTPAMSFLGDTTELDAVHITGSRYRDDQMRGYARYARFLASIITDESDFVRLGQLELFLERYFPEIYAMKSDSTYVSEAQAENIFGVHLSEVQEHYRRHGLIARNDRRKNSLPDRFYRYVKDPLVSEGIRLDTVLNGANGSFIYRYVQWIDSRPGLRKISIALNGELLEFGRSLCRLQAPEDLVFYVSSLSTLADLTPRYIMNVVERTAYDNTHAFIDFGVGKAVVDSTLEGNAAELRRIRKVVEDITSREEFELDSLVVTASCSPEGDYRSNARLAEQRAQAVKDYLGALFENTSALKARFVPENWEQLERIVQNDSLISKTSRRKIMVAAAETQPAVKDHLEGEFTRLPEYRYLREKIYPRLRSVRFDFYLSRKGMIKDTIHTTIIDSVYLAGVQAIQDLDYKRAVELLRPYHNYNTALAYLSAGYNHSALNDLEHLAEPTARSEYLRAVVLARLGRVRDAMAALSSSISMDPAMVHRANLDPELSDIINH